MNTRAVARVHLLVSVELTLAGGVLAALCGLMVSGPFVAVLAGAVTGAGVLAGSVVIRRRVFAGFDRAAKDAHDQGYAEGLAQAVLLGIATYGAAVFPLTGGGVSAGERSARRTVAYRISADDGLPHAVRTAAAAALEALDRGEDREAAQLAVKDLHLAVLQLRTGPDAG
ncbi:hypothetical protein [Streptomyces ficellus]|uniref:Uncharacterized protein n=1 Tax=Streptomyces ficellus TaxID=1977088 RepID=A0A6I6FKP2_9ACTN|nr:hypothetical protein [Streptomyces ficellus]QGV81997.1 hypothetical protein EIZ62_29865 [Streptomyces ficellus]